MRRLLTFTIAAVLAVGIAACENATNTTGPEQARFGKNLNGNGAPSGAHYNLNVIGVKKGKNPDMKNTSGHTIFVPLWGNAKIWLCESGVDANCADDGFKVLDRNGTDADGALFALPNPDPDGDGTTTYSVFARALGTPGGSCATDASGELECSVIMMELSRDPGKSKFDNVSKYLLYIYADIDEDGNLERVPLFDSRLQGYFWDYDNSGLKLAQLRFYEGVCTTVPDATNPGGDQYIVECS